MRIRSTGITKIWSSIRDITIITAYAPQQGDASIVEFWDLINDWISQAGNRTMTVLLIDANGKVGPPTVHARASPMEEQRVRDTTGPLVDTTTTENGGKLLGVCTAHALTLLNTIMGG